MGLFDTYKLAVDAEITTKTTPSSIDPADVGTKFKELCDLIELPLTDINAFTASTADPFGGEDGDVHLKTGVNPIEVYQLISGTWTLTGELPITLTDIKTETVTPDTDPVVLTWSDTIPGDTRTYAQKHGNTIQVQAETPSGGLLIPGVVIARTGDDITTVTISYLETGSRIIII